MVVVRKACCSAMLVIDAGRLAHRLEPHHGGRDSSWHTAAPPHARRHAHAPRLQSTRRKATSALLASWAAFLGRSPDTATTEGLRRLQLHLVDAGTGPVTINATITGLRFFFDGTLGQPEEMGKMQNVQVPRKLPVILSPEEAGRLIAAAPNLKQQAAMSVVYGAGLRVGKVVALNVSDIDGRRMTLRA